MQKYRSSCCLIIPSKLDFILRSNLEIPDVPSLVSMRNLRFGKVTVTNTGPFLIEEAVVLHQGLHFSTSAEKLERKTHLWRVLHDSFLREGKSALGSWLGHIVGVSCAISSSTHIFSS